MTRLTKAARELPPLPEPAHHSSGPFGLKHVSYYTADQMRAYALRALEEAEQQRACVE